MLNRIVQMSFVPVVAIVLSLILFIKNKTVGKNITRLYIITVIIFGVLVIVDSVDLYLASLAQLNYFRYVTSIIGYSLRPVALLLVIFTLVRFENNKKMSWILLIPGIINLLICVLNPAVKWMFSFTSQNDFVRGPLGFLPFLVSGIYLVILIYEAISNVRHIEKTELIIVFAMVVSVIIAVILESVTELRCLLNGVGVISADCYFLYLNTKTYRRDELTSLLNRRSFYTDVKSISGTNYIVCIDMNNLKVINDTKGHIAGDQAIIAFSKILRDNVSIQSKVYRVGGDEFVVLTKQDEKTINENFAKINRIASEIDLSIAFGYAMLKPTDDFEQVYITADKRMYECKEKMKSGV